MRVRFLIGLMASVLAPAAPARAGYLIDPAGGTTLWDGAGGTTDDAIDTRPLGAGPGVSFTFFGVAHTDVTVSINGQWNFDSLVGPYNTALPASQAVIAPLWDDLAVFGGGGESIVEKRLPGVYSVTYDVADSLAPGSRHQFQVVWFGTDMTLGGNAFRAGDIAFVYAAIGPSFARSPGESQPTATVGLSSGAMTFVPLVANTNGLIASGDVGSLPARGSQFALFRWDANSGTYSVTTPLFSSAVPEPASALLTALGAALALLARRRPPAARSR